MGNAIDKARRVNGRGDHTDAGSYDLAILVGSGRQVRSKEKGVIATSSLFGEGNCGCTNRGSPKVVGLGIVPIDDEQACSSAEENSEVSVCVEEPLASKSGIGNVGLVRAIAGLDVLGARLERDAETLGRQEGNHTYSRSAMALRTEDSSTMDFWSIIAAIKAVVQT